MDTLWFLLTAGMIATYVVLDGFDLGVGILHLHLSRTDEERTRALESVGPVWDGNEVWLLAGGGTLVLAFPVLYATAFSGFYLPLMLVLWLLIGRACAIELRHHGHGPLWHAFWDRVFCVSSVLLAVCFGAALGNVVRGVPLKPDGTFFEPLWTHGGVTGETGILDWYTVLVGVAALGSLAMHGATWLAVKMAGEAQQRARRAARRLVVVVGALAAAVTLASMSVQPHLRARLLEQPWIFACAALAVGGLALVWRGAAAGQDRRAFLGSCLYLVGMLLSAALSLYPYVLPSNGDPALGLTAAEALAPHASLATALWWWIPGVLLAASYTVFTYRWFRGRISAAGEYA